MNLAERMDTYPVDWRIILLPVGTNVAGQKSRIINIVRGYSNDSLVYTEKKDWLMYKKLLIAIDLNHPDSAKFVVDDA